MALIRVLLGALTTLVGIGVVAPAIILGLPFWVISCLSRAFVRILEPRVVSWQQVIEFCPTIGWKPKPNLNAYGLADEVFRLSTDSQGWRGKTTVSQSDVVVVGDSFAFGQGASDKEFFPEVKPRLRMKAIGAPGYNMVQQILWMERLSEELRGKLVVWFIYYGNDLYENLVPDMCNYRMPFVRGVDGTGDWEIVTSHVRPSKWFHPAELRADRRDYYEKLAELCGPGFLSGRAYEACEFLIRGARDICSRVGAQLAVMTIPEKTQLGPEGVRFLLSRGGDPKAFDPDFPDHKIGEVCRKLRIPFIAGKSYLNLSHYKERDPHWNIAGHRTVSEVLSSLYHDLVLSTNADNSERG